MSRSDDKAGIRRISHLAAIRKLLHPRQIRETVMLTPQPGLRNSALAGLQVTIATLIALPAIQLSSYSHLIGYAALGTLVALFGRFAPRDRRAGIVLLCLLCQTGVVLLMSLATWAGVPREGLLILLALVCGVIFYLTTAWDFGPPGALIFVFAAGVAMREVASFAEVLERTAATGIAALLAWLICIATEAWRDRSAAAVSVGAIPPLSRQLLAVTRMIVGAGIAAFIANAVGGHQPGWAAMGAVAVLQGSHLHISMNRALQRTGGNVVGAVLVGLFLLLEPSVWSVIFLVAFLAFMTEVIIGSNYGLGQILVTPMALLMSYLALPELGGAVLSTERVINTVIGTLIGMVLAVAFSTVEDRLHLARHHSSRMQ